MDYSTRPVTRVLLGLMLLGSLLTTSCGGDDQEDDPQPAVTEHTVRYEVEVIPSAAPVLPTRISGVNYNTTGTSTVNEVPPAGYKWSTELRKQTNIAVVKLGADAEGAQSLIVRLLIDGKQVGEKTTTTAIPGKDRDSRQVGLTWSQATGIIQ